MKIGALLTAMMLLCAAFALALPDNAEAARMGGGKSFGSKPFMSTPAKPPVTGRQSQAAGPAAGAAAASRPGGMLGGMGGLFGGLLAGTLLGSLFSGGGFGGGGGFMDIIILGILVFVGYKLFTRFRQRQAQNPAMAGAGNAPQGFEQPMRRTTASVSGWDAMRDGGAATPQTRPGADVPPNFDVDEFLRGAKMAYTRMQKSWDNRDLGDIAQFATPSVVSALERQMADDPNPSHTEIMLVNAELLGVEQDGQDERAQVYFDVLMREDPTRSTPESVREIWHFLRAGSGSWKLDGIQQVD